MIISSVKPQKSIIYKPTFYIDDYIDDLAPIVTLPNERVLYLPNLTGIGSIRLGRSCDVFGTITSDIDAIISLTGTQGHLATFHTIAGVPYKLNLPVRSAYLDTLYLTCVPETTHMSITQLFGKKEHIANTIATTDWIIHVGDYRFENSYGGFVNKKSLKRKCHIENVIEPKRRKMIY